ncbi:FAD-dependent oxidoreductase [Longimicrobium sp.]|uniref:FAD-dependent oxidoreductase n=1 Tax=Longimicrobium sp. TaxID=2029185 RepID=UPI002C9FA4B8|nr:FAD-dependent oxidoreductase [Longimicrobium sp.]HSU13776.1 FAD-dependent oxidoreductase [Longimicrobium sp.]
MDATAPDIAEVPPAAERMFPVLTPAQVERMARHGRARAVRAGEVLMQPGDREAPLFAVKAGELEVVRPSGAVETPVAVLGPGGFTGELNMLSGRRAFVRARVREPGEVVELNREQVLALVQTDAELGEILMRAFILRRVGLIAQGFGDVVLVGSAHSSATLRIREFLTRNGHPFAYVDLDRDEGVQALLDRFGVSLDDVPVLICRGEVVLRNPTNQQVADCLGFNAAVDAAQLRDVVIVGAGPAGLAAAVYAASEGLDALVLETSSPGGQAASSSRIENYLGFPTGVSGQELAARAYTQAQKFGAQMMIARGAARLACDGSPYAVELGEETRVRSRTVVIATGAEYRGLGPTLESRFDNAGLYHSATFIEAQLCRGAEVVVVGGGNAAGQAAVFLAETAACVHMLVRSAGLAETMSRYLVRRIEEHPGIVLRTRTEIEALEGDGHLERVRWRQNGADAAETREIRHVFVMTGAVPATAWLHGCVALDAHGFVKTGPDLTPDDLAAAGWPLGRPPHLLETSLPGVFAVGDVRSGNVKRVASAVGEGSIAISFVHRVLQDR